jgi:hypothetical protein
MGGVWAGKRADPGAAAAVRSGRIVREVFRN